MKPQSNHPQQISSAKKLISKMAFLFIFLIGTAVACQTMDTQKHTSLPVSDKIIVYGKIDSIPLNKYKVDAGGHIIGMAVMIVPHKYPCSDSTGRNDAILNRSGSFPVMKSGTYGGSWQTLREPCFTAFVAFYDSSITHAYNYTRLLAGPKKLGSDFTSHFSIKWDNLDSVRIDFVVQDSAKE